MQEVTVVVDLHTDVELSNVDRSMYIERKKAENLPEDISELCHIFKKSSLSLTFFEVEQVFAMSVDFTLLNERRLTILTERGTRFTGTIIDETISITENNIFVKVSHIAEAPGKTYLKLQFMEL